jgi:hypothetical protein
VVGFGGYRVAFRQVTLDEGQRRAIEARATVAEIRIMTTLSNADSANQRWGFMSAGIGAVVWTAAPWLPLGTPPSFASLEHLFLFFPLFAAPLAIVLLSTMERSTLPLYRVALRIQPAAALTLLVSFFIAKGALAGVLTAGWLVVALAIGVAGSGLVKRRSAAARSDVSLLAAHFFLPVGAVWLLLSRLGVEPLHFSPRTVLLAALHFHFSGFTLQILIAATGRQLQAAAWRLRAMHRCAAIGAIAGIPLIAAGNALSLPALKMAGVAAMVFSSFALAIASTAVAREARSPMVTGLLCISAGSITGGMVIAGIYGVGELLGAGWIGIPRMVQVHGLLNALGFTLCGLGAHLHMRLGAPSSNPN